MKKVLLIQMFNNKKIWQIALLNLLRPQLTGKIFYMYGIYSVENEDAGRPSLLNKLALLMSLQAYLEYFGSPILFE
jgi:hypothetical protein